MLKGGAQSDMQWDQKDETDCTVAGRGDEESKVLIFVGCLNFHAVVPMMLAT